MKMKRLLKMGKLARGSDKMEAKHLDEGKVQLQHILAMPGLDDIARVGEYGFKKYGDRWNYRKGMPWTKLLGSCSRHLAAFIRGQNRDSESGLPHLAHLAYDCLMLLEYPGVHDALDDRSKKEIINPLSNAYPQCLGQNFGILGNDLPF